MEYDREGKAGYNSEWKDCVNITERDVWNYPN